jgi:hypothetical protein
MKALLALFFVSACSSSDSVEPDGRCPVRYSIQKSEFFGEKAYRVHPMPSLEEVQALCDSTEQNNIQLVCDWARRKSASNAGDIANASDDAYWPENEAQALAEGLNEC